MSGTGGIPVDIYLPYMRDVTRCEQSLRELNLMWRMIEASAKMNCPAEARAILPTMAQTRAGFNRLEEDLVTSLVREKVADVLSAIGTKAKYVIDIVVRNLYERTADVGFLATDRELCNFAAGVTSDVDAIRFRLRSYRNKYTVYDEIVLLDTAGNVLVQIDEATPLEGSTDPLIAQSLASDSHVETFRASDLRPLKERALIYSRRMLHPETGVPVGVLCLCFNFEQEMADIFRSHRDEEERSNMLLLDAGNRVIASADERWIPVGAVVPVNREGDARLQIFGGREYLVRTFAADGYQGYMGPPGWQGQVMIPVDIAFHGLGTSALASIDQNVASGLLSRARSFCPPLFDIMTAAETIRRVVWNGQVMTAGRDGELLKLKTILDQISETGKRSNDLFAQSIRDLYETVLASSLRDAEFVSHLLVDLLDRNLYERSNDCRWWAQTPELRHALAAGSLGPAARDKVAAILQYINGLYTVYTRIFVYDGEGCIVAGTHPEQDATPLHGTRVDTETLEAVRGLRSEQDYHVTPFASSRLYGGRPTYVYHAAVRDPRNESVVVGGIGIVFDAEPEFNAMLDGAIREKEGSSAFFVDRSGTIIASTDVSRPVGAQLELDMSLLRLANGCSASRIVTHDGHYAVMGCTVSSGYREFKVTDGYRDDIIAVVFQQFGVVRERTGSVQKTEIAIDDSLGGGTEYATFFVNGGLFAFAAAHVLEALPASAISPISMGGRPERIGVLSSHRDGEGRKFVWVFDFGYLVTGTPSTVDSASQVLIVRWMGQEVGLLVDELHAVPEFPDHQIVPVPLLSGTDGVLVRQVIKANEGEILIQVIDVPQLFACIKDPSLPVLLAANDQAAYCDERQFMEA